jgi:hypothetical protein
LPLRHGRRGPGQYGHRPADGLSGDSFAVVIQEQLSAGGFEGTSAQLHKLLTNPEAKMPADWPKDGRAVTTLLHRIAPAMRKLGWSFTESRDSHSKLLRWKFYLPARPESQRDDYRSSPQEPQPDVDSGDAVMSGDIAGPSRDDGREEEPACDFHRGRRGYRRHCPTARSCSDRQSTGADSTTSQAAARPPAN